MSGIHQLGLLFLIKTVLLANFTRFILYSILILVLKPQPVLSLVNLGLALLTKLSTDAQFYSSLSSAVS